MEVGTVPDLRRRRVALLLNLLSSTYQQGFRAAVERVTQALGIDLLVVVGRDIEHSDPNEAALNAIFDWVTPDSVDGAIILSGVLANSCGTDGISRLCKRLAPLPTVSVGLSIPGVPSVVFDNKSAMRVAVEHLIVHHGLKRIAYIGGPPSNQEARERLAGYCEALSNAGIAYEADLVEAGHFSVATGEAAMAKVIERTSDFQGVVAANDYMALGAMDALRKREIQVPDQVLVVGFDDAPVARFARCSLTSVAQPVDAMAAHLVETLLGLIAGESPKSVPSFKVHLALRESCTCGQLSGIAHNANDVAVSQSALAFLEENGKDLVAATMSGAGASHNFWETFVPGLVTALVQELKGQRGAFQRRIEEVVADATRRELSLDDATRAVAQLRRQCQLAGLRGVSHIACDDLLVSALVALSTLGARREGRRAIDFVDRAYGLRYANQQLSVALELDALAQNIQTVLPNMGVSKCLVATLLPESKEFRQLASVRAGVAAPNGVQPYPCQQLLPNGFADGGPPWTCLVLPLTFEQDVLGLAVFDGNVDSFVCETVRAQISSTLKLGGLHRRVVEESALRERLAHQQLLGEMAVAKRIQTALAPTQTDVPGLEVAAVMLPAEQVGGDYYDIIQIPDGAWFGIGDVTGHGLVSGLIMLMVQSVVSTLVQQRPDADPAELVIAVNAVMRPNIRSRLNRDEHVTFMLLRYEQSGQLVFAGAHEDMIVYELATRKCRTVSSEGMWVGILDDIAALTEDSEIALAPGDVVLLYTDGLIEARNEENEQFGIERVFQLIEDNATAPVGELCRLLTEACLLWQPVQQDDISCVVLRKQ